MRDAQSLGHGLIASHLAAETCSSYLAIFLVEVIALVMWPRPERPSDKQAKAGTVAKESGEHEAGNEIELST